MVGKGHCDMMREVATPYVTNGIADLLGVPDDDRKQFTEAIDTGVGAGSLDPTAGQPRNPRGDRAPLPRKSPPIRASQWSSR